MNKPERTIAVALADLDIIDLMILRGLFRRNTVYQIAADVNRSQPAISQRIEAINRMPLDGVGPLVLLIRGNRLVLTDRGKELAKIAQRFLKHAGLAITPERYKQCSSSMPESEPVASP